MKNKLLHVTTSDGLYLHGYYAPSEDKKTAILYIHGFEGNFYQNTFVHVLACELEEKGIGFLTGNTRGCGKDTDFCTTDGLYKRIGSRYEVLEEAHLDITAWLTFLSREGYIKKLFLRAIQVEH
jgi:predicted alpha/beta-fold hydrolase